MERQTLQTIKKQLKTGTPPSISQTMQLLHSLTDSNLEALNQLEGGDWAVKKRVELIQREVQIRLALADLRVQIATIQDNIPADVEPAVVEGQPLIDDLGKVIFTMDMIDLMLKAKGPQWNREWKYYQPRIEEEFET